MTISSAGSEISSEIRRCLSESLKAVVSLLFFSGMLLQIVLDNPSGESCFRHV